MLINFEKVESVKFKDLKCGDIFTLVSDYEKEQLFIKLPDFNTVDEDGDFDGNCYDLISDLFDWVCDETRVIKRDAELRVK